MCRVWAGTYLFLDPHTGAVLDRHSAEVRIGVRGSSYSQRNSYKWADGRQEVHNFPAAMRGNELIMDTERLKGYAKFLDDDVLIFTWTAKADGSNGYEFVRLLSPKRRARTLQVCGADGVVSFVVHIEEELVSDEDVFIDM